MKNITEMLKTGAKCLVLVVATAGASGCGAQHGTDITYETKLRAKFGGNSSVYSLTEGPTDRFVDTRAFPGDAQPYADPEHGIGNRNPNDGSARTEKLTPFMEEYLKSRAKK